MAFDSTGILSLVVALAAVISPVITTKMNHINTLEIKKLDMEKEKTDNEIVHKRALFEDYLKQVSVVLLSPTKEERIKLKEKYMLILPYIDSYNADSFKAFNEQMLSGSLNEGLLSEVVVPSIKKALKIE